MFAVFAGFALFAGFAGFVGLWDRGFAGSQDSQGARVHGFAGLAEFVGSQGSLGSRVHGFARSWVWGFTGFAGAYEPGSAEVTCTAPVGQR